MSQLGWSDALKTGHEPIDREHHEMLRQADIIETYLKANDTSNAHPCCQELRILLQSHFEREERLLADLAFPRLATHLATHEAARQKVSNIISTCQEDCRKGLSIGCPAALRQVLLDDVILADLDFKSYLQHKGIVPRD